MYIQPVWNQGGFSIIPFTKITHHCILKDTLGGIYSIFVGYHTSSIFSVQARNQLFAKWPLLFLNATKEQDNL